MGRQERPLDSAAGPLEAFAGDLRRLRAAAGSPSYRSMAQRAAFSASALSAAARGTALPSLQVTLAYVTICGGDKAAWERRWTELHLRLAGNRPIAAVGNGDVPAPVPAPVDEPARPAAVGPDSPAERRPATAGSDQQRVRLLTAMWQFWIDAVLQPALSTIGRLPVGLIEYHGPGNYTPIGRTLDSATITRVYEQSPQLLIVGECGTGKTMLLLELARDLLAGCAQHPERPVPMVVQLSSWSERRRPIEAWLTDELSRLYSVDSRVASALVAERRVVPLLDGLGDVPPEHRAACVAAINTYQHSHGAIYPLVVTCRTQVYESLRVPLRPRVAVELRPLTLDQVRAHLDAAGPRFAAARAAVRRDPALAELMSTPMLFGAVTRVFAGQQAGAEPRDVSAEFVAGQLHGEAMPGLGLEPRLERFRDEQVLHWLGWIAHTMRRRGLTVFDPDLLGVDMLSRPLHRRLVTAGGAVAVGLTTLVLAGVVNGFAAYSFWIPASASRAALAVGGLSGAVAAVICSWSWLRRDADAVRPARRDRIPVRVPVRVPLHGLALRIAAWAVGCGLLGLGFEAWFGPVVDRPGHEALGLLALGGLGWFLDGVGGAATAEAIAGLVFGAFAGQPSAERPAESGGGPSAARRRARDLGRGVCLLVPVTACGLLVGVPFLCFVTLRVTKAALQRRLLRWLLTREGAVPHDYRRFLHDAHAAALLDETGGGYRFAHALLGQHFAELYRRPERGRHPGPAMTASLRGDPGS